MLRLEGDVKSLQTFANRAYTNDMNIQKTILRDLLGGKFSCPILGSATPFQPPMGAGAKHAE
jgi:hypothetical protein